MPGWEAGHFCYVLFFLFCCILFRNTEGSKEIYGLNSVYGKKIKLKKPQLINSCGFLFGGLERIRTAVGAFAEPSLAARPRDPLVFRTTYSVVRAANVIITSNLA